MLPTAPPSVHYELTPLGVAAGVPLDAMVDWVRANALAIVAAQHAHDRRAQSPYAS